MSQVICARCGQGVLKSEEIGGHYHRACYKCANCKTSLSTATVKEQGGEVYCALCISQLAAGTDTGTAQLDAEIQKKLELKWDSEKEANARTWLESVLEEKFTEGTLQAALQNGIRLCQAANKVAPGIVKSINKQKMPALQRENISNYLKACSSMSFNKANIFETTDLYDGKNMVKVVENIYELANKGQKRGLPAISKSSSSKGGYDVTQISSAPISSGGGTSSYGGTSTYETPSTVTESAPSTSDSTPTPTSTSTEKASSPTNCADCGAPREAGATACGDCGSVF